MTKTISVRLTLNEYRAWKALCEYHNLISQDLLHSIIVDALVEEGYDALRSSKPKRCEGGAETSEDCGATTS